MIQEHTPRPRAYTDPESEDPRLRGRSYAIPYARVWRAVLDEVAARRGWSLAEADPAKGEVLAEARTRVWKLVDDVWIRVSLDENGLTRVDLASTSRRGRSDFGTNARRIVRFLHALDRRLRRTHSTDA